MSKDYTCYICRQPSETFNICESCDDKYDEDDTIEYCEECKLKFNSSELINVGTETNPTMVCKSCDLDYYRG